MRRSPGFRAAAALALCLGALAGCSSAVGSAAQPTATVRTPVGTPTRMQLLTADAQGSAGSVPVTVSLTTDAATAQITVTATLAGEVARTADEVLASQERVKAVTLALQRALWMQGDFTPSSVKVSVLGPLLDDYFDRITDWYGGAQVEAKTATTFNWSTLTADTAWDAYDVVWLRPYYTPFQQWGAPNPTQP